MTTIILGPILGDYDGNRLKILVETNRDDTISIEFMVKNNSTDNIIKIIDIKAKKIQNIDISGLKNNKIYEYMIRDSRENELCRYEWKAVKPENIKNINIVSCNKKSDECKDNLWEYMWETHIKTKNTDLLLHIGDQVYESNDCTYSRAVEYLRCFKHTPIVSMKKIKSIDKHNNINENIHGCSDFINKDTILETIYDMYRQLYIRQWTTGTMKKILASVCNRMIIDDHDIHNGYGIHLKDDLYEETGMVNTIALRAYHRYQLQLWRDLSFDEKTGNVIDDGGVGYSSYNISNSTLLLLMDVRNSRVKYYDPDMPYIGTSQYKFIEKTLSETKCENLILISSIPIILGSQELGYIGSKIDITNDSRDQYVTPAYVCDHMMILDLIKRWKYEKSNRFILLVGGDIHFGLKSTIYDNKHRNNTLFDQVITSPITNEPVSGFYKFAQRLAIPDKPFVLYDAYQIHHHNFLYKKNYCRLVTSVANGTSSNFVTLP
ncbi:MAG: hypothetical protein EOP34_03720 [Rickettsiales bacterium]|nr:MAG: hypothetical protein EOP34_03720 [Rickettsiales bacterium]